MFKIQNGELIPIVVTVSHETRYILQVGRIALSTDHRYPSYLPNRNEE